MPTQELPIFLGHSGNHSRDGLGYVMHSAAIFAGADSGWMIRSMGFTGRQNHYVGALSVLRTCITRRIDTQPARSRSAEQPEYAKKVWVEIGPSLGPVRIERLMQTGETAGNNCSVVSAGI